MQSPSRPCAFCSTPFSGRRNKLYCSEHCRYGAWVANRTAGSEPQPLVLTKALTFFDLRAARKKWLVVQIEYLQSKIKEFKEELAVIEQTETPVSKT